MIRHFVHTIAGCAVIAGSLASQTYPLRATLVGGGRADGGKCTIEFVVDGAAEVEIRGDSAMLRNISGQPPEWRRFECTAMMPPNPVDFRFAGIDGRGRQTLTSDPRRGGIAVVRIEDPSGGSDRYVFEITWTSSTFPSGGRGEQRDRDHDAFYRDREEWRRGPDWQARLFQRVKQDIEYVQAMSFPFGTDQYRLARTKQQLGELQQQWGSGHYDQRQLDEVIQALRRVVQDNRLSPRDHDLLSDDLNRLVDFRARRRPY